MEIEGTNIVLGQTYRDPITGIQGVATGITLWLYGCARVCVSYGWTSKDGNIEEKDFWLDTDRAEFVPNEMIIEPIPVKSKPVTGGPVAPRDWLSAKCRRLQL